MLLSEEQLKEWVNYERKGHLEQWLREHGVRFWYGRGGRICTTLNAIEMALGLDANRSAPPPSTVEFV